MKSLIRIVLKWALRDELWMIHATAGVIEMVQLGNHPSELAMLRARVHALERHLHVTNSWHRAEMGHPYDGFTWFKMEKDPKRVE